MQFPKIFLLNHFELGLRYPITIKYSTIRTEFVELNVNDALPLEEWDLSRLIILHGRRYLQCNVNEKPAGPGQELMKNLFNILKFIFSHPLSSRNKWAAFKRFVIWQGGSRIIAAPIVFPFVASSKLIVEKGMTGATGNIYAGLHEFEDMAFTLHVLRPNDVFVDVGANIGSYTILSSAVAGAFSIALEPIPSTFTHLKNNVSINNVESLVTLCNCGAGAMKTSLRFTKNHDTVNHVLTESTSENDTVEVPIVTLNEICRHRNPLLIKMDVEGFEMEVLKGAKEILSNSQLKAIIIELNGSCRRYGVSEEEIHALLREVGFRPFTYEPFSRSLRSLSTYQPGNTIYLRDESWVRQRIQGSKKYKVMDLEV